MLFEIKDFIILLIFKDYLLDPIEHHVYDASVNSATTNSISNKNNPNPNRQHADNGGGGKEKSPPPLTTTQLKRKYQDEINKEIRSNALHESRMLLKQQHQQQHQNGTNKHLVKHFRISILDL